MLDGDQGNQQSVEESFRYALEGVVETIKLLEPYCKNIKELSAMAQHGIDNEGQLRLLIVLAKQKKK